MYAGKVGLVVITVERYFKVVHAVAHRKYYRDWMTKAGVALPWISGLCFFMFPPELFVLPHESSVNWDFSCQVISNAYFNSD